MDFWKLRPWEIHWILAAHTPDEDKEDAPVGDWREIAYNNLKEAQARERSEIATAAAQAGAEANGD